MNMKNDPSIRLEALLQQGSTLHAQNRLDDAQHLYSQAALLLPTDFRAWYLLGIVAMQSNQPQYALECLDRAVRIDPRSAEAHIEHGNALSRLNRYEEAIQSYTEAIGMAPNQWIAHYNRANALQVLKRHEAALAGYDQAIALKPNHAAAFNKRADSLYELRRYTEAVSSYDGATAIRPDYIDAYRGRGNALFKLAQYEPAAASYQKVIEFKHDDADAHNNRGNALYRLKQIEAAVASYDAAITLDQEFAGAFYNRGKILDECKQYAAAIADYDRALALKHDSKALLGMRLQAKLQICDWRDIDADLAQLHAGIEAAQIAPNPFTVLIVSGSAALQKKAAQNWVLEEAPANRILPAIAARGRGRGERIRIGYFSADYHDHATLHLMAGLFEMHDRSQFEVTAFSFGPDSQGDMRKRLRSACENFVEVRDKSDHEIALLARNRQIDIAVDLKGFTQGARPGIFAARSAPLQVGFLGYPGTMGAPYMDYLIADLRLIPHTARQHYTEKIIYLPNSYQVNDSKRRIAAAGSSRQELGLPPTGFVFCCFNNNCKITPATFESWMRILARVDASVLWLLEDNPTAAQNLRREAARGGVDSGRLIFTSRTAPAEHLARHRAADLFVDTFPCNAHTTASDSLWAGLPVLTCAAEAFAGRVAASLLNALGLEELIASDEAGYEALAVKLAEHPEALADIARKLERNRTRSSLFDTQRYTVQLESAYTKIYDRHRSGLAPDDLDIETIPAGA
jgi:protein O-GlcNAc transferase